jgi:hypothetical protein
MSSWSAREGAAAAPPCDRKDAATEGATEVATEGATEGGGGGGAGCWAATASAVGATAAMAPFAPPELPRAEVPFAAAELDPALPLLVRSAPP